MGYGLQFSNKVYKYQAQSPFDGIFWKSFVSFESFLLKWAVQNASVVSYLKIIMGVGSEQFDQRIIGLDTKLSPLAF